VPRLAIDVSPDGQVLHSSVSSGEDVKNTADEMTARPSPGDKKHCHAGPSSAPTVSLADVSIFRQQRVRRSPSRSEVTL
jgi:hypothetical protein